MGNEESTMNNTRRNSNSRRDSSSGVGTAAAVGIGIAAVGAAAIAAFAYANEKQKEEEERNRATRLAYSRRNISDIPAMESLCAQSAVIARPTLLSRCDSDDESSDDDIDPPFYRQEDVTCSRRAQKKFEDIYEIIEEAAKETKRFYENNPEKLVSRFQDYRHNQYRNKLCQILNDKLDMRGIPFEKEKQIDYVEQGKLRAFIIDIYINGIAVLEVKAKESGLNQENIAQMEKYVRVTKLPGILINFGTYGGPHIRIFRPT